MTEPLSFATLALQVMNSMDPPLIQQRLVESSGVPSGTLSAALRDRYMADGTTLCGVERDIAIKIAKGLGKPDDFFDNCSNVIGGKHRTRQHIIQKRKPGPYTGSHPQSFAAAARDLLKRKASDATLVSISKGANIPLSTLQHILQDRYATDGKTLLNISRETASKLAVFLEEHPNYFNNCSNVLLENMHNTGKRPKGRPRVTPAAKTTTKPKKNKNTSGPKPAASTFAQLFKQTFQALDPPITRYRLAKDIGVSDGHLTRLLRDHRLQSGELSQVSRELASRVAVGMGKPPDYFEGCSNLTDRRMGRPSSNNGNGHGKLSKKQQNALVAKSLDLPVYSARASENNVHPQWEIKKHTREQVTITGPMKDRYRCQVLFESEGFVVKLNERHINSETLLDGDPNLFTIIMERIITEG